MARRAEAEENYWPGFVDALSTIVMVITFLLILLSIVIFVLSQNKAKTAVDTAQTKSDLGKVESQSKSKTESQSKKQAQSKAQSKSEAKAQSKAQSMAQSSQKSQMKARQEKAQPNSTVGNFKPKEGRSLTQTEKVESKDKLKIRSRDVINEKRIVVAPEEKPKEQKGIKVTTAKSVLTLEFTESNVKIDEASVLAVQNFLSSSAEIKGEGKIEIRSYANSSLGSISHARRIAYYRAMSMRNQLLKNGVDRKRIAIRIRKTKLKGEQDLVKVYLKP